MVYSAELWGLWVRWVQYTRSTCVRVPLAYVHALCLQASSCIVTLGALC